MSIAKPHVTRVGKRNQVTIPAAMLRELGVTQGDHVEIISGPHCALVVRKADSAVDRLFGMLERAGQPGPEPADVDRAIDRASEEAALARYRRSRRG